MRASLQGTFRTKKKAEPFRRHRKKPRLVPQICPIHGTPMIVRRTTKDVRYHYCSHPECDESTITARK